jgi:hypothetical protein
MREQIERATRHVVSIGRQAAFQIVVSLVATAAVGLMTRDRARTDAPSPAATPVAEAPPVSFEPQPIAGLLRATFSPEGIRTRRAYPTEFAAVFGPELEKAAAELPAGAWPNSTDTIQPKAQRSEPKPQVKTLVAQHGCAVPCGRRTVVAAAVLPPPRPNSLAMAVAEAPAASAELEERGVRLLGLRLPGFVPSGREVARTVASLGDSVSGLFDGMR